MRMMLSNLMDPLGEEKKAKAPRLASPGWIEVLHADHHSFTDLSSKLSVEDFMVL